MKGTIMIKPYNRPAGEGKQANRPLGRWKCTPLGAFGTTFSPEGELLAVLCIEVLMSSEAGSRANFPLRGGKGTGFVGSRRATENPVTRFPLGEVPAGE